MKRQKVAPDGFVIYRETLDIIAFLPEESAGKVLKAAADLFRSGAEPEDLDLSESMAFSLIRRDIQKAFTRHEEVCERNKRIAESRRSKPPAVTNGHDSSPVVTKETEPEQEQEPEPEQELEPEQERKGKESSARFTPPSVDDVRAYCRERGNYVDPQTFVDFYAAKGWVVGRTKMKDWRAAVRTWERRNQNGRDHGYGDSDQEIPGVLRL